MPLNFSKTQTAGSLIITNSDNPGVQRLITRSLWTSGSETTNPSTFGNSIDGNASTRWYTGASQAVGQTYTVNFNQLLRLNRFVMDTTNSPNDYPTAVAVSSSLDGTTWTPIGTAPCAVITTYNFPQIINATHLRLTLSTVRTANWWSIHEFNISGSIVTPATLNISETGLPTSQMRLYLDASNPRSYSGTGNNWFSLTTASVSASFPSGKLASYSDQLQIGGLFGFSQTELANTNLPYGNPNNWTLMVWVKPGRSVTLPAESTSGIAAAASLNYVLMPNFGPGSDSGAGLAVATNGVVIGEHQASYAPPMLVYSTTINTWTHIAAVYENKVPKLYINGVLVRTATISTKTNVYLSDFATGATTGIGGQPGSSFGGFQGDLAMFISYNRSLNASEIARAYNVHRRRFGV